MHNVLYLPYSTGAILAPRAARTCQLLTSLTTWPCGYPVSSQSIDKQLDRSARAQFAKSKASLPKIAFRPCHLVDANIGSARADLMFGRYYKAAITVASESARHA